MDLIGNIQYVENRFGGRNPNQNKGKLAQKNTPHNTVPEKDTPVDSTPSPTENDTRLGRKIDITA